MATIWFKQTDQCRYEVRTAGNSIRLYSNGVFHSQWNPKRPIAGHLWDLLFFPVCFQPDWRKLTSALILGVGGGAVINHLQSFCELETIVAVDLDEQHFFVADKFFGIKNGAAKVKCVCQEAQQYIGKDNSRYHFILEDLFINEEGTSNAVRAIKADEHWLSMLAKHLTDDGVLVMNFESVRQLRTALTAKTLKNAGFIAAAELSLPRYENVIAVLSKSALQKDVFWRNLKALENKARFSFVYNEYALRFRKV